MCAAIVNTDPFNMSAGIGKWASFSCNILCSHNELITWFVNGSPLPSIETAGFMFQTNPPHSYCSTLNTFDSTLSLKIEHPLDFPVTVHCAIVSVCDLNSNCTATTCFSEDAYLEGKAIHRTKLYFLMHHL